MTKTFCPLPWTHLATHPQGGVSLCCESDMTDRNSDAYDIVNGEREFKSLNTDSFEKIFNSDYFKTVRKEFLNNQIPDACKKCFEYEKLGLRSKRLLESDRLNFSIDDAIKITRDDGSLDSVKFEFIELRLGNHCNLACRTCNPISSTKWIKDWEALHFEKFYIPRTEFNWPLDENFWNRLCEHSASTRFIYINGGEPLLIDKHLNYLQFLIDNNYSQNISLMYSTNSTVVNDLYIDAWTKFKHVDICLSIDDIEDRNEYLRYPSKWNKTMECYQWFLNLNTYSNINVRIMQTVSIMNIYYLKEFYEFFKDVNISRNYVNFPEYYSPKNLTREMKNAVLEKHKSMPFETELTNLLSADGDESRFKEFLSYNERLDVIRNEKFSSIFTEWSKIINAV